MSTLWTFINCILPTYCIYMDKAGAHPYFFWKATKKFMLSSIFALWSIHTWLLIKKYQTPVVPWEFYMQRDGEKENYNNSFL